MIKMKNYVIINDKQKIHTTVQLLLIMIFSLIFCIEIYAAEAITVSIDNHQPIVGEPLSVSVKGLSENANLFYDWMIDNELANCQQSTYTPCEDDYEKWIKVSVYNDGELVGSDRIWFSKLPVVYIDTGGVSGYEQNGIYISLHAYTGQQ